MSHHKHENHHHDHDHCKCQCGDQCQCECHQHYHHYHEHEEGGFSQELLELADDAWMEVLYEKVKEHIVKVHGKQLDSLAEIVSESNSHRWKLKLEKQKVVDDYRDKLENYFYREK